MINQDQNCDSEATDHMYEYNSINEKKRIIAS